MPTGAGPAGPVGHQHIAGPPALVPGVEHPTCLRGGHGGAAHFVDVIARRGGRRGLGDGALQQRFDQGDNEKVFDWLQAAPCGPHLDVPLKLGQALLELPRPTHRPGHRHGGRLSRSGRHL